MRQSSDNVMILKLMLLTDAEQQRKKKNEYELMHFSWHFLCLSGYGSWRFGWTMGQSQPLMRSVCEWLTFHFSTIFSSAHSLCASVRPLCYLLFRCIVSFRSRHFLSTTWTKCKFHKLFTQVRSPCASFVINCALSIKHQLAFTFVFILYSKSTSYSWFLGSFLSKTFFAKVFK